jgi:hypothetical protein
MTMRLGFAIAAFLEADILLLDEVFAVGDESFQRKCFGVIAAFKQRGGTILFVSHDASAVERLCDRAVLLRHGGVGYDGPVHEALARYRRALVEDADSAVPAPVGVGGGAVAITNARLVDPTGLTAERFLAGDPLVLELDVTLGEPLPGATVQVEVRDVAGLLVAEESVTLASLGWDGSTGTLPLRLTVPDPRLQFGRFNVQLDLVAADGRLVHRLGDPLPLLVYPDGASRALVRFAGTWSSPEKEAIR